MHQGRDETMNNQTKWLMAGAGALGAFAAAGLLLRKGPYSFRDKAVFITGGSRGLGLRMARILAEEGARLTLISRHGDGLQSAVRELASTGAEVTTFTCDVRDRQQVQEAIDASAKLYGSLDVLINNAGVIQVGPFENMDVADFENAMAIHAWGPLYTILAALPHMRRQGGGRIVNISSIGGKIAVPHLMPYAMSKFALAGLSDAMRAELRKYGITVTSVYPGLMRTGSHVHAKTKGHAEREFAWFSFLATNPIFAINADRAARQIIEASRKGSPELVITTQANLAVMAQSLVPGVVARMSAIIERFLPKPTVDPGDRRAA
jgi:NAD(P)-dependent dehydrogenase (short-subunit alcohol dehydrogenase family)